MVVIYGVGAAVGAGVGAADGAGVGAGVGAAVGPGERPPVVRAAGDAGALCDMQSNSPSKAAVKELRSE